MLLENACVSLKIRKCPLFGESLDYLSHILLLSLIDIAKDSTSAIADANFLGDMTQLRSFLCACNVY